MRLQIFHLHLLRKVEPKSSLASWIIWILHSSVCAGFKKKVGGTIKLVKSFWKTAVVLPSALTTHFCYWWIELIPFIIVFHVQCSAFLLIFKWMRWQIFLPLQIFHILQLTTCTVLYKFSLKNLKINTQVQLSLLKKWNIILGLMCLGVVSYFPATEGINYRNPGCSNGICSLVFPL